MAFTEPPPPPPAAAIPRFRPNGTPTQAMIDWETRFFAWLKRLAASIP